ncbi:element excision factor XisH family protein [Anabaena sp. UHCC 0204]|uniref:element excision factor XisH family protein n=1 Tax=Anabaena sp. UHCC 0204 TaxID=2590009 RepID=UPI00352C6F25
MIFSLRNRIQDPKRVLYLAVSSDIHERFFITSFIQELVTQNQLLLLIYNIDMEVIEKWLPLMNTDNI